jgi:helicase
MLNAWIDERTEEWILETYNMAPGLLRVKLDAAEWLAYSCSELIPYMKTDQVLRKESQKLQIRLKHGVKEELLPLVAIKGVGRVRARKLYSAGFKTKESLQKADVKKLGDLLGEKIAKNILKEIS